MRILVVGASGRFGSRSLPALLARGHDPIAFVRYPSKLRDLLPPDLFERITVVEGDGEDVPALVKALTKYQCHGLICCAGSPSAPNGKGPESRQGYISEAVASAAAQYSKAEGVRLRAWWLTGIARLDDPYAPGKVISDRIPKFRPEHSRTVASVTSLPQDQVAWSILCPSALKLRGGLVTYPPEKRDQNVVRFQLEKPRIPDWLWWIIGFWWRIPGCTMIGMLMMVFYRRFTHEAVADELAKEFEGEQWVGHKVGY